MANRHQVRAWRMANSLFGLAITMSSALCWAGLPFQVRNVNSSIVEQSSRPIHVGRIGATIYFAATDSTSNSLWSSDGTDAGTRLIRRFPGGGIQVPTGGIDSIAIGGRLYFIAFDPEAGSEIWVTDGTTAGTARGVDLVPGSDGSNPQLKGSLGNELVFAANDSTGSRQLFLTNGTSAGTRQITSFTGTNAGPTGEIAFTGSKFYFSATGNLNARSFWVSDGTAQNTREVTNSFGATSTGVDAISNPQHFQIIGSNILYTSSGKLYRIDIPTDTLYGVNTTAGTPGFGPPSSINASAGLINLGGSVVFLHTGNAFGSFALWTSDGTMSGTGWVAEVNPGLADFDSQQYPFFRKLGNRAIFLADDGVNGPQLWSTDGTAINTIRLTGATQPANEALQIAVWIATISDRLYFTLSDGASTGTGSLWVTDGTLAGTGRVAGLPAIPNANRANVQVAGDQATVFALVPGPTSASLYRHDVAQGVSTSLAGGLQFFLPGLFTYEAPQLVFSGTTPGIGTELWHSDGTPAGTALVRDIYIQTRDGDSAPENLVDFNGQLAFVANDGVSGREIWMSDGTSTGTRLLVDINTGSFGSDPAHLMVANGWLHFFANPGSGVRLMRVNASGSVLETVASLAPRAPTLPTGFPSGCVHDAPVVSQGRLYFAANDGTSGLELWSTDGTPAGTRSMGDLNPGFGSSDPCSLTVHGGQVFFRAATLSGRELWVTDGTPGSTRQVLDIAAGAASSSPSSMASYNGSLYFGAQMDSSSRSIWRTDGTPGSTLIAVQLQGNGPSFSNVVDVLGNRLMLDLIVQSGSQQPVEADLFSSDGTTAGSQRLATIDLRYRLTRLVNANRMFFVSADLAGFEPWVSDGTPAGTRRLKDINPAGDSLPTWFADFHGVTIFGVTDPVRGKQVWRTDGTESGTVVVGDLAHVVSGPEPYRFAREQLAIGQNLFLVADDPVTGRELYAIANDVPLVAADSATVNAGSSVSISVLSNDQDTDGQLNLNSVRIAASPANGTAGPMTNGTVQYTPRAGFTGTETFTYTVDDNQGGRSNAAIVTVTVTSVSNPGSGSGGGGSIEVLQLLVLLLFLLGRKASCVREWRTAAGSRAKP